MNTMPTDAYWADQGQAAAPQVSAVNVEEPFEIEELFFSRTDERGVIQSYNTVFERVAGFSGEELQGAPHKLIRHPDMPKAVFWLLWNGLQRGVPVGAYVKNKTKEGRYYWVFAMASPVDGGYLSVRLKPTSKTFETVQGVYAEILQAERDEELSPEDSAKRLVQRIEALGFPTYAMFQAQALYAEYEARRKALKRPVCPDLSNIDTISTNAANLRSELNLFVEKFTHATLLTANLKIFAAKLPVGRSTINEIAKNYDLMLRDIQNHLKTLQLTEEYDDIWEVSRDQNSFFLLCAAHLMEEMCDSFEEEWMQGHGLDKSRELRCLNRLRQDYNKRSLEAVIHGVQSVVGIKRRTEFLRRMILGLSTIRIACRVEAGMLRDSAKGLDTIVGRLDEFHDDVEAHLAKVQKLVNQILKGVDRSQSRAGDKPRRKAG